jgi:hypothetical protein
MTCACADNCGLILDPRRMLSVSNACGRSLSHKCSGNIGSHDANPAIKWFLNVCIALSAALRRWMCGGTNW